VHQLIHERCYKGGLSKRGSREAQVESGLISRIPGGDRIAVTVGVVQMRRVNDQMQGRSV